MFTTVWYSNFKNVNIELQEIFTGTLIQKQLQEARTLSKLPELRTTWHCSLVLGGTSDMAANFCVFLSMRTDVRVEMWICVNLWLNIGQLAKPFPVTLILNSVLSENMPSKQRKRNHKEYSHYGVVFMSLLYIYIVIYPCSNCWRKRVLISSAHIADISLV